MDDFDKEYIRILDRMRRLCSRREYCTSDIYAKASGAVAAAMRKMGLSADAVAGQMAAEMVSALKREKYLDDNRYASAFARDKASISGWGKLKIRNALASKGLERHIVDAALEEIDGASAGSRMEKVLEVKFRSLAKQSEAVKSSSASGKNARAGGYGAQEYGSGDRGRCYELKMKMLRFALGRGYGYEEAAPVIERLLSEYSLS